MSVAAIISIIGTVLFLGSFAALNAGFIKSDSYIYQGCNLVGAACFTYTAIQPFNPGLFITELAWAIFGAFGIYKIAATARKRRNGNAATAATATEAATPASTEK